MVLTLGNSIAPLIFVPGFMPLAMLAALPATLLAAVIERPFYTQAGKNEHTIWYSIQANVVSLLAGIAMAPVALAIMPLGSLVAVALSVIIEGSYLARRCPGLRPKWGWVIAANVISSLVLMLLPGISFALAEAGSLLVLRPRGTPFDWPQWVTAGVCVVVFIFSFYAPRVLDKRAVVRCPACINAVFDGAKDDDVHC